jgi:hypothetical protein
MRKLLYAGISLAAAAAFASPALAQPAGYRAYDYAPPASYHNARTATAVGAGVVGGTVAGLGVSEGWWGAAATAALPTTVAGAAAIGGVAGMGTVAAVDFMLEPCRGFAAVFDLSHGECVNGHYVGDQPPPRRMVRHRYR